VKEWSHLRPEGLYNDGMARCTRIVLADGKFWGQRQCAAAAIGFSTT